MIDIKYRTPTGDVFTDAMASVANFLQYRGGDDEIISVSEPYDAPSAASPALQSTEFDEFWSSRGLSLHR